MNLPKFGLGKFETSENPRQSVEKQKDKKFTKDEIKALRAFRNLDKTLAVVKERQEVGNLSDQETIKMFVEAIINGKKFTISYTALEGYLNKYLSFGSKGEAKLFRDQLKSRYEERDVELGNVVDIGIPEIQAKLIRREQGRALEITAALTAITIALSVGIQAITPTNKMQAEKKYNETKEQQTHEVDLKTPNPHFEQNTDPKHEVD